MNLSALLCWPQGVGSGVHHADDFWPALVAYKHFCSSGVDGVARSSSSHMNQKVTGL